MNKGLKILNMVVPYIAGEIEADAVEEIEEEDQEELKRSKMVPVGIVEIYSFCIQEFAYLFLVEKPFCSLDLQQCIGFRTSRKTWILLIYHTLSPIIPDITIKSVILIILIIIVISNKYW